MRESDITDKKGNIVWEGDILDAKWWDEKGMSAVPVQAVGLVIFKKGKFIFKYQSGEIDLGNLIADYNEYQNFTRIGSIHFEGDWL